MPLKRKTVSEDIEPGQIFMEQDEVQSTSRSGRGRGSSVKRGKQLTIEQSYRTRNKAKDADDFIAETESQSEDFEENGQRVEPDDMSSDELEFESETRNDEALMRQRRQIEMIEKEKEAKKKNDLEKLKKKDPTEAFRTKVFTVDRYKGTVKETKVVRRPFSARFGERMHLRYDIFYGSWKVGLRYTFDDGNTSGLAITKKEYDLLKVCMNDFEKYIEKFGWA